MAVLTRDSAIACLEKVAVAPITFTIRGGVAHHDALDLPRRQSWLPLGNRGRSLLPRYAGKTVTGSPCLTV